MKITKRQLRRIISEELSMFSEGIVLRKPEPHARHNEHMIFVARSSGGEGWHTYITKPQDIARHSVAYESDKQEDQLVQDAKTAIDSYISSGKWPEGWTSLE